MRFLPVLLFLAFGYTTQVQASTGQWSHLVTSTAIVATTSVNKGNSTVHSLDAYKWKNRLLLLFAPAANNPAYERQLQLFAGQPGFDERNLLLVKVLATGTSYIDSQPIDATTANQLRSRFNVSASEFRVILVGKDGTEKRQDRTPVSPQAIFSEIDAMPMRQQEMRSSL